MRLQVILCPGIHQPFHIEPACRKSQIEYRKIFSQPEFQVFQIKLCRNFRQSGFIYTGPYLYGTRSPVQFDRKIDVFFPLVGVEVGQGNIQIAFPF